MAVTWQQRLAQFRKIYGDKYEYDYSADPRSLTKIKIICREHGVFLKTIKKHLIGQGCLKCSRITRGRKRRLSQEQFLNKSRAVHNNFYSYEKTLYRGLNRLVIVTCPIHGDFNVNAAVHINGHKCPQCALASSRITQQQLIEDFKRVHGDRYDYSKVVYKGLRDKILIGCKIHGDFWQKAENHRKGSNCPYCGGIKSYWPTFVNNCNKTHNNKYNYPDQEFHGVGQRLRIICPEHGEFYQIASEHQYKYGCPECGGTSKYTQDEILIKFKKVHGDKYDYIKVSYMDITTKVTIICPEHGPFQQSPRGHIQGGGCPLCSGRISKEEIELCEYIREKTNSVKTSDRTIIAPLELDIVLPELKIAIEYNGLYWHSSAEKNSYYHKVKTDLCKKAGYRLIHIWQDDWLYKRDIVKNFIDNLFGESKRIYARKTIFKELDKDICRDFLKANHIQGAIGISRTFGLYYEGELVVASAFIKKPGNCFELVRHACKLGIAVTGALGKITKNAATVLSNPTIYSFCDLAMYTGASYIAAGFVLDMIIPPDYKYIVGLERRHKFNFRRNKLEKFLAGKFKPELSEVINMEANGYYRIFDCGKAKYVYNKNK